MRQGIQQLPPAALSNLGMLKDLGEWEAQDWDGRSGEGVLDVALVEDVPLAVLGYEEDAGGLRWWR